VTVLKAMRIHRRMAGIVPQAAISRGVSASLMGRVHAVCDSEMNLPHSGPAIW
jgi:hypothetical protein